VVSIEINGRPRVTPLGAFDDPSYARLAIDDAARYQGGDPFPHIVLDDFANVDLTRSLSAAFV
jgi:hypothetical protein